MWYNTCKWRNVMYIRGCGYKDFKIFWFFIANVFVWYTYGCMRMCECMAYNKLIKLLSVKWELSGMRSGRKTLVSQSSCEISTTGTTVESSWPSLTLWGHKDL